MIKKLTAYKCTSNADLLDQISTTAVSGGWVLHDDQSASGYIVLYSTGESGTETPGYVQFNISTGYIITTCWQSWNATTHAGVCRIGPAADLTGAYILLSGLDTVWIFSDADHVLVAIVNDKSYGACVVGCQLGGIMYDRTPVLATLASGISAGSSVTATIDEGAVTAALFADDIKYQIIGAEEYRELVSITSITDDEITIDEIAYDYPADSKIGMYPFRWQIITNSSLYGFPLTEGNTNSYMAGSFVAGLTGSRTRTRKYLLAAPRVYWAESGSADFTYTPTLGKNVLKINETHSSLAGSLFLQGRGLTGQSTGSNGSSTLIDTGQSWSTNDHAGLVVVITGGTGFGQCRGIVSNNATTLTLDQVWDTVPDATSYYTCMIIR